MKFLHEYRLLADGQKRDNGYWEIVGDYLYNKNGGRHLYTPHPDDEIIEVEDWSDIIKMTIRDDSQTTGWIAPDGEFFGCNPLDHNELAIYLFNMEENELEEKGYIKIFENPIELIVLQMQDGCEPPRYEAYERKHITAAQRETLEKMGFKNEPASTCWYC